MMRAWGQTKQLSGGSNAIDGFPSCFPPASTPASFALLSSTQFLRYRGRFHQQTRFEIPVGAIEEPSTCPTGEARLWIPGHPQARQLPGDTACLIVYPECRRGNFLRSSFVYEDEVTSNKGVQMEVQERALEQANYFITLALVLLLIAGMMVVGMTTVLSSGESPFSSRGRPEDPAAVSAAPAVDGRGGIAGSINLAQTYPVGWGANPSLSQV